MRSSAASVSSNEETCPLSNSWRASRMDRFTSEACDLSTDYLPVLALVLIEHSGDLEEITFSCGGVAQDFLNGPGRARLVRAFHVQVGQNLGGGRDCGRVHFLQHGDIFKHVQKL